jgi:hypothetical protein
MSIKRGALITVAVVLVLIVAVLGYLWSSINAIVEAAIEKYGSQIIQTSVAVKGVDIRLTEGSGAISGLTISNPKGFKEPYAFSLGQISTAIDLETVTQNPVVIKEILIKSPKAVYEINKSGQGNINELKTNITRSSASASSEGTTSDTGPAAEERKLIIRKLVIEQGELTALVAALDDTARTAKLPRIEMKNLGAKQGGATGAEIAQEILTTLTKNATEAVSKLGLEKYLGKSLEELQQQAQQELEKKAREKVDKELDKAIGDVNKEELEKQKDSLKKLFGK